MNYTSYTAENIKEMALAGGSRLDHNLQASGVKTSFSRRKFAFGGQVIEKS